MLNIFVLIVLIFSSVQIFAQNKEPQSFDTELRTALIQAVNDSTSFTDRFAAEVWYTDMSNRMAKYVKDPEERLAILQAVHQEATRADLAPELVLAVMHVESLFDQYAISIVGARGLMQVMPFWLKELDMADANLFDIQTNLRMGTTILKYYLDKENGNLFRGLGRYNGSLGKRKYPDKVIAALNQHWFRQ